MKKVFLIIILIEAIILFSLANALYKEYNNKVLQYVFLFNLKNYNGDIGFSAEGKNLKHFGVKKIDKNHYIVILASPLSSYSKLKIQSPSYKGQIIHVNGLSSGILLQYSIQTQGASLSVNSDTHDLKD